MTPDRQVQTALQERLSVASIPIHARGGPAGLSTTPIDPWFDPADQGLVADLYPVRGLRSLPVRA